MTGQTIAVSVGEGIVIQVEGAASDSGEEEIANRIPSFDGFTEALSKIAVSVRAGLAHVQPSRAVVEFGVDVSLESGQLTAMMVKGSGSAHVTVTLEWDAA
jgi:hypothetical protein